LVIAFTSIIALGGLTVFHNISPNVANAQIQSSSNSIDWAIGGYSEAVGYSQYQFQWIPSDINSSSINYGGVLLNVPVEATGTMPDGSQTIEVWIQAVVTITNTGEYYPSFQVWAFSPTYVSGISPIVWTSIQISPNEQIAFMQLNYTTYDGYTGWWYILGLGTGTLPTALYYLAVVTSSGGLYLLNNSVYVAGASLGLTAVGDKSTAIQFEGEYLYPSIGLEINENSYGDFTSYNPGFVMYGSFFVDNNYLNNVYYANSSSLEADSGFMAGENPPSTSVAGGGATFENTAGIEYAEAFGTKNGINSQGLSYTQMAGTDLTELTYIQPYIKPTVVSNYPKQTLGTFAVYSITLNNYSYGIPLFNGTPIPLNPFPTVHPVPWYIKYIDYEVTVATLAVLLTLILFLWHRYRATFAVAT
jgi:hypothetical protein